MNYKIFFLLILFPNLLLGVSNSDYHVQFGLVWILPFIGLLLSIALVPLINENFWHKNFGKISFFWALSFSIPFIVNQGLSISNHYFIHAIFLEYIPFIILLFSLFTISGGIVLRGNFVGTPLFNTSLLLIGTILASWMGTTGAAMLLIRPLIRANKWRKNIIHVIIFFIFLVGNIGGSLTPLGDPPLFIGFLKGVDFFWTTQHMFFPMIFVSSVLLVLFYFLDAYYYKNDLNNKPLNEPVNFSIHGKFNILLLVGIVLAVIFSGFYQNSYEPFNLFGNYLPLSFIFRDLFLIVLAFISYKITSLDLRKENAFTWFPITEVAKLFAGIFITVIPAISILSENNNLFSSISNNTYFWLTGVLSGFLDNAPTYLVFFNAAGANANILMENIFTLLAISSGSVFMGAMTYIGNAPNFMVRAIAEENQIKMPSFFGYMAWSISILMPIFLLYSLLWF